MENYGIVLENEASWEEVCKGVHYFIIANLSIKEIMENEKVSADAVKSWAREVRKKLREEGVEGLM